MKKKKKIEKVNKNEQVNEQIVNEKERRRELYTRHCLL